MDKASPIHEKQFAWPTINEVQGVHNESLSDKALQDRPVWKDEYQAYVTQNGRIWPPDGSTELQQRLCTIPHPGVARHRVTRTTVQSVKALFEWSSLDSDVKTFCRGCLHYLRNGSSMEPRPFGESLHATRPNELIHFEYLEIPAIEDNNRYILILDEEISGYVELIVCSTASADKVQKALLEWLKRLGTVYQKWAITVKNREYI
uniref:AlNc14C503G11959 protein n=1 Tax=Albugo laibachii Nc14 TaxID=890382 RepID=F0X0L5_9STRA|nr:AlNc14C503G11959 [Albugo laibachii Nc14]|eukprot:CCA27306.1 AlNc14C503G11959 [Albugo laibachii Nc14]